MSKDEIVKSYMNMKSIYQPPEEELESLEKENRLQLEEDIKDWNVELLKGIFSYR